MKEIARRLDAYIQAYPFDSGDGDCDTVLDQLYQAYAESHESDPPESARVSKNWSVSWKPCPLTITTPSLTSAAVCAQPTRKKPSVTACFMGHT